MGTRDRGFDGSTSETRTTTDRSRRAKSQSLLPDAAHMRRWLLDAAADDAGAVASWLNPHHPGYPYPEAAGLFLSSFSSGNHIDAAARPSVDRVASRLCVEALRDGAVGRDGILYLFDSAVALAGLLRYRSAGGNAGGAEPFHRLHRFVCARIMSGAAVVPGSAAADGRWSTQFGAHLMKCLHSLFLYARAFGEHVPEDVVAALINSSGHQPSPVYVHPFCYEQEGHVVAEHYGFAGLFEPLEGALDWLAALQQDDGGILAFANGMEGFGEPRSDVTAQAARLWLLGDRARYADSIARAFAFLARCQSPSGGIRYAPGGDDICTWSTMFCIQAVDWFAGNPSLDELL
jgi:hypothetical protein